MAPEVIKGTQTATGWMKADIWSLGCTVVEMITGALPFSEYANPMTAMYQIASGKSPPISHDIPASPFLREFVSLCCAVDPTERPTVEELLQHSFVSLCCDNRKLMCNFVANNSDISPQKEGNEMSPSPTPPLQSSNSNENITPLQPTETVPHLSEGQLLLQKLNRVVAIDINANSDQDEVTFMQNQITPVIHQTRKRRSVSNPVAPLVANPSRSSPLLPPTGKKNEKKISLLPISPPTSLTNATSPSSIIRAIPSAEECNRSRCNSSACPTPIMFSNNHDAIRDVTSSSSPSMISDGLTTESVKKSSAFGARSASQPDLFEYQIPITITSSSQETGMITPPPLSRSASLNDALRPIAPLSGQKINICCEAPAATTAVDAPDVKDKDTTATNCSKLSKKQPLQSLLEKNSKEQKMVRTIAKPKATTRSKSANVSSSPNPSKILLPPMQTLSESSSTSSYLTLKIKPSRGQSVPELPLRLVQSAPSHCTTQSMNLPPLLSTISSPKRKSTSQPTIEKNLAVTASCPTKLSNRKFLGSSQRRPSYEEFEQEGGILAPR
jgi:serine/threonine protein kinase